MGPIELYPCCDERSATCACIAAHVRPIPDATDAAALAPAADTNQGSCVDLFAPGVDVYSVCGGQRRCGTVSPSTYAYASGSSMAVPHVAGAAAVYLSQHPEASPQQVGAALIAAATSGRLDGGVLRPGTPNKLLSTALTAPASVQAAQGPP